MDDQMEDSLTFWESILFYIAITALCVFVVVSIYIGNNKHDDDDRNDPDL